MIHSSFKNTLAGGHRTLLAPAHRFAVIRVIVARINLVFFKTENDVNDGGGGRREKVNRDLL